MGYNLGYRHQPPRYARFNYMEKAEYWALVWGTIVMAVTGILLWAHDCGSGLPPARLGRPGRDHGGPLLRGHPGDVLDPDLALLFRDLRPRRLPPQVDRADRPRPRARGERRRGRSRAASAGAIETSQRRLGRGATFIRPAAIRPRRRRSACRRVAARRQDFQTQLIYSPALASLKEEAARPVPPVAKA